MSKIANRHFYFDSSFSLREPFRNTGPLNWTYSSGSGYGNGDSNLLFSPATGNGTGHSGQVGFPSRWTLGGGSGIPILDSSRFKIL